MEKWKNTGNESILWNPEYISEGVWRHPKRQSIKHKIVFYWNASSCRNHSKFRTRSFLSPKLIHFCNLSATNSLIGARIRCLVIHEPWIRTYSTEISLTGFKSLLFEKQISFHTFFHWNLYILQVVWLIQYERLSLTMSSGRGKIPLNPWEHPHWQKHTPVIISISRTQWVCAKKSKNVNLISNNRRQTMRILRVKRFRELSGAFGGFRRLLVERKLPF